MLLYHDLCLCSGVLWTTLCTQQSRCNIPVHITAHVPVNCPINLLHYCLRTRCRGEMYNEWQGRQITGQGCNLRRPAGTLFGDWQDLLSLFCGVSSDWQGRCYLLLISLLVFLAMCSWLSVHILWSSGVIDVCEISAGEGSVLQRKANYCTS